MTPSARLQAAIEILDAVIAAASGNGASADRLIAEWLRTRRFAGSKDRRAIRELVYGAIRACGPLPPSGRAAALRLAEIEPALAALFDGSAYGPARIAAGEPVAESGTAPAWLVAALDQSGVTPSTQAALLGRAPLDLRANALKTTRETLAAGLPIPAEPLAAPNALRLAAGTPVETWPQFADGLFEVQDHGSQLACATVAAAPGEMIVDICAGAGGKTLALAAEMANTGRLIACDNDRARLARLAPRAERAGAIVETRLLDSPREAEALADLTGKVDGVLVDAPCSGTGTWRRNPEARWRLTPEQVARYAATQARLLHLAATLVQPGGRIGYVVCSLLDAEGADGVAAFLARHPGWRAEPFEVPLGERRGVGIRLDPEHAATDGFYFARLRRA